MEPARESAVSHGESLGIIHNPSAGSRSAARFLCEVEIYVRFLMVYFQIVGIRCLHLLFFMSEMVSM